MTRSAVSSLTSPRVSALSARETVPGCTRAARATSRRVTGPPDAIGGNYADVCSARGKATALRGEGVRATGTTGPRDANHKPRLWKSSPPRPRACPGYRHPLLAAAVRREPQALLVEVVASPVGRPPARRPCDTRGGCARKHLLPVKGVPPAPRSFDRRAMAFLSLGHLCVDLCQGALPALLPFLIAAHHWSYGQASALVLAATISSSIVQPLFGHLSDGRSLPWLLPGGVALAAAGISLAGVVGSYWLTFAVVVASGLGVAAYHPEASRFANYVAGEKRATAMSFFSVGGNAGFALGPGLVTPLALAFGLGGTPVVAVLPAVVAVLIARELGRLKGFRPAAATAGEHAAVDGESDQWRPFALLSAAVAARSVVYFGLMTLVPLYFVHELHASEATANTALTVMLAAGALGTLVGGRLADRFGRRVVLRTSMAVLSPLMVLLLLGGVGVGVGALAVMGAGTIGAFGGPVLLGQGVLPAGVGIASGVTLGLAIGFGGLGAAVLGVLADATSLRTALEVVAVLPLPALALALLLPEGREHLRARAKLAPRYA